MCFLSGIVEQSEIHLHDVLMFFKYVIGLVNFMFGEHLIIIVHSIIMASCILGECCQFLSCMFQGLLDTFCFAVEVLGTEA